MNKNGMTPMESDFSSGSTASTRGHLMPSNQYNTSPKTTVNTPKDAETKGLHLLRELGYEARQSPDWLATKNGQWVCIEVKCKELFEPGHNFPHRSAGLAKVQLNRRQKLLHDLSIRTYLLVYEKGTDAVYGGWLDELEAKNEFFDTPINNIRVYPIKNFSKGVEAIRGDLNGH